MISPSAHAKHTSWKSHTGLRHLQGSSQKRPKQAPKSFETGFFMRLQFGEDVSSFMSVGLHGLSRPSTPSSFTKRHRTRINEGKAKLQDRYFISAPSFLSPHCRRDAPQLSRVFFANFTKADWKTWLQQGGVPRRSRRNPILAALPSKTHIPSLSRKIVA